MPATFIKSLILTLLITLQIKSTDAALWYVQSTGLPKELFILIGAVVLLVGIKVYRLLVKRIAEKYELNN